MTLKREDGVDFAALVEYLLSLGEVGPDRDVVLIPSLGMALRHCEVPAKELHLVTDGQADASVQLMPEHERSRLDWEEDRLLGVAVGKGHLPACADEDDCALLFGPLELLLNAWQEMADGHGLRACQRLDVFLRHVLLSVIVRVEVA